MDAMQRRTIVALAGLVALWVVVYWSWQPRADREPTVIFDQPQAESGPEQPRSDAGPIALDNAGARPDNAGAQPDKSGQAADESARPGRATGSFGTPPFRTVIARDGDTFERIARRELGSATLWPAIARANPFKDPQRLRAGDRVKIPLDPSNPQARPEPDNEPEPEPVAVEYTVQRNDTLSGIAKRFYGSVRFVDFLYEANRDRLASPDSLKPGQVLIIPPKPGDDPGGGG